MFLIASGAYCTSELQSEFGKLPPSFLPLGNRRLFQHQVERAPAGQRIYLSLPDSFDIPSFDALWLKQHDVTVLRLPEELTLGESIVAALNLMDISSSHDLTLLYGDTLLLDCPTDRDCVAVSTVQDNYHWAYINDESEPWIVENCSLNSENTHSVINGYFTFSQPTELIKSLIAKRWHFLDGVSHYHSKVQLTALSREDWLDFGHIHTYFQSKATFTTQRSFNELVITPESVKKSSVHHQKIAAEAQWFENVPAPIRRFLPQLLGHEKQGDNVSYELEYLHHTALNELLVFGDLPVVTWKKILKGCFSFLDTCAAYKSPTNEGHLLHAMFNQKTESRITDYCQRHHIDRALPWTLNGNPTFSINDLIALSNRFLPTSDKPTTVIHGDFCFSNILFDFRTSTIKTIDPRGLTPDGAPSIYGDLRYDIAKLSHSIIGCYDLIIAGHYHLDKDEYNLSFSLNTRESHKHLQQLFSDTVLEKYALTLSELLAMQIQLFVSMLPLHSDDVKRQQALLANAFRLGQELEELAS
ncbi:capsular biosynthesis protein [Enterovibrio sp. 27052020O]|uniref:capsular biosynthesis protein n=1 Tax=Enterovibrio sp. 27052020O TaxID=3241166 RepID=UPI00388EAA1C